jgi:digeranylgeranylglycerophospholipid reductase
MSNTELVAKSYEVIIIGAGPAGSYTASKLASDGYSVAVLERKKDSGLDICCTGIISTECFDPLVSTLT